MITMVIASLCLLAPVPGEGVSTSEHAPVQPPPSPEFELLIDQLDASSWEVREAAVNRIARDTSGTPLEWIEVRLARGGLSLEQVVRLLRIAEIRLLHAPRGAIGIQMAPDALPGAEEGPEGVRIRTVIRDMPAEGILQAGDLITHIEDEPIKTQEDLATIVQRHWPGDTIMFRVLRAARPTGDETEESTLLEFEITLGSTKALRESNSGLSIRDPDYGERKDRFISLMQRHGVVSTTIPPPRVGSESRTELGITGDPIVEGFINQFAEYASGKYPNSLPQIRRACLMVINRTISQLDDPDLLPAHRDELERRLRRLEALLEHNPP